MKFGICEHRDGILIEVVPDDVGYTYAELVEALKTKGPARFSTKAQILLLKKLYGEAA